MARAQIIPDGTLPSNSRVTLNGNTFAIEGGTQVGSNLFHSFREFSVLTGNQAVFNNTSTIQNIISRVTGGTISNIDGTLRTSGKANLLFINPNGIIFGPNAQLNIGGSFIGSTANSIKFTDGSEFSATNPQAPPLLIINLPIGLQFGSNPGSIINQSQVNSNSGLRVPLGRTLALIGGDLILNGGNLTAFGGNILLGSVASPGLVSLITTPTGLALDYTGIQNFGNIELLGTASANASGLGGGAIQITGGNVTLRDRSNLTADTLISGGGGINIQAVQFTLQDQAYISASTGGGGAAGGITVRATDSVELVGTGFDNFRQTYLDAAVDGTFNSSARGSGLFAGTTGVGRGGNITIDTRRLTLRDGAGIFSPTFSQANGGNIALNASESVEVIGSGVATLATNQGNAGALTINTGKLIVEDGAIVTTITFGSGDGGNLTVNASDSVEVSKTRPDSPLSTSIATSSVRGTGKAGDLEINTQSLLLQEGGAITTASGLISTDQLIVEGGPGGNLTVNAAESVQVIGTSANTARSFLATGTGTADAGDLTINTKRLIIQDGAAVGASTGDAGQGGKVSINASELVEVSGQSSDGRSPSILATASGDPFVPFFFPINPTGPAGELNITTGKLSVRDGASVTVKSFGSGDGGRLSVVADAIALDNGGRIDASTRSGNGGNIELQARDIRLDNSSRISADTGSGQEGNINIQAQDILLRHGSQISTNAENSQGGNITINTNTLVAVPQEDSDITANAMDGPGGRVSITASGIFGTQFREQDTPLSDITATSNLGPQFNGTVQIDIRGINPTQGLLKLPETIVDPSRLIATGCSANEGNSFAVTGRGGLSEDPTQTLNGRTVWQDVRLTNRSNTAHKQSPIPQSLSLGQNQQPIPLVEATGWVINANGQVELRAYVSNLTSHSSWQRPADCPTVN